MDEINLQTAPPVTSGLVDAYLRDPFGNIWNGSAFEAYATADVPSYAIPMAQQGTASGFWTANFPAAITQAGQYSTVIRQRLGAMPSESDPIVGTGAVDWPGVAIVPPTAPAAEPPTKPIVFLSNVPAMTGIYARMDSGELSVNATTGALETRATATLANYLIPLSDAATAGTYLAAVPAGTPAGRYSISIYQTSVGAPGGYALVGADYARFDWSGTAEVPTYAVTVNPTAYNALTDLYAEMGEYNAQICGDPDNSLDAARLSFHLQNALDRAANMIDVKGQREGFPTPLASSQSATAAALKRIGAKLAAFELFQIRGIATDNAGAATIFLAKKAEAERDLAELFWLNSGGFIGAGADTSFGSAQLASSANTPAWALGRPFWDPLWGAPTWPAMWPVLPYAY